MKMEHMLSSSRYYIKNLEFLNQLKQHSLNNSKETFFLNVEKPKNDVDEVLEFFDKILKGEIKHRLFDRNYRKKLRKVFNAFGHPLRVFIFQCLYIKHSLSYEDLKEIGFSKQIYLRRLA